MTNIEMKHLDKSILDDVFFCVPKSHREKLMDHFDKITKDADNADNWRVAYIQDYMSLSRYADKQRNGCCGSHDEYVKIDGVDYLVGFNYGH